MTHTQARAFGLGYRSDPADARDRRLGHLWASRPMSSPPTVEHTLRQFVEIVDQGPTNSCVANAIAQAIRVNQLKSGEHSAFPSREFIYYNARAYTQDEHVDDGTFIRNGVRGVVCFGVPAETSWPFDVEDINTHPSWRAYHDAYDFHGIRGYYRIFDDADVLEEVRDAISSGRPVVAGWEVDEAFLEPDGPKLIDAPKGPIVGGHALCIVGYFADGTFEIANSWGTDWRDGGFFRATPEFVLASTDRWVIDVQEAA